MSNKKYRNGFLCLDCGTNRQLFCLIQLPFREHKEIEDLLNMNDSWESLAGDHLGFTLIEIDKLR